MIAEALAITALGAGFVPAHARNLQVAGLHRVADPAPDTCSRQWAFVDRRGRTIAEYAACWHEVDNWTHHKIVVTYSR